MLRKILLSTITALALLASATPASATTTWVKPPAATKIVLAHSLYVDCRTANNTEHGWMSINTEHWDSRWPYPVQTAIATGTHAGVSHEWPNDFMDRARITLYRADGSYYGSWSAVDYARLDVRYLKGWSLVADFHWNVTWTPDRSCTTTRAVL